jgi:hypothetical protein
MKAFFNDLQTKGSIGWLVGIKKGASSYFIEPKDAFFGGRTVCQKLYAEASEDKEISYMDIISLYPAVNFNVKYPVGIPEIILPGM